MRSVTTLVLTLLVCGCISNPQISIDDVGQIDISNSLVKGEKVLLSTIAKDVKYIELQSDCNCLLGRIEIPVYGVKVHKDRLFISDESRILSFDKNGKFLAQIGSQGRGPGEYMYPDDFAILNESDKIAVFSQPSKKVFFYSLDGIFEKDISIDFYPTRMISFMNKLVFISPPGRRDLTDYFTLTIMEESGEIFSRLLKRENEKELDKNNDIALRAYSFQTYVMDSSLYYFEKYYDTIWRVSSEFTIDSKTHFYYGDDRRSIDDVLKLDPSKKTVPTAEILSDAMSFVIPQWYIDSHRFSFFRIVNKGNLNHIVYDKNNSTSKSILFEEGPDPRLIFSFFNDIDGGLPFWPSGALNDSVVFNIIHGFELKQHIARNGDFFQTIPSIKRNAIQDIISHTEINDNPILMMVNLKK